MGRECRGLVTQLDSALRFLRVRAVIVGTRQHSLEAAGSERRYLYCRQPLTAKVIAIGPVALSPRQEYCRGKTV